MFQPKASLLFLTGVLLSLPSGFILAQNTSFPSDVTIRRSSAQNTAQYLVYVADASNLEKVKTVVPDAFIGSLDSGQKIVQVGRFNNLAFAEKRTVELKRQGIDAQILSGSNAKLSNNSGNNSGNAINNSSGTPVALPGVPSGNAVILATPPVITPLPAPPSVTENLATRITARSRYFVIIPSVTEANLEKARNIVPSARLNSSERGTYIEVQGYPDRSSAETLNATMRAQGFDSRVIYY